MNSNIQRWFQGEGERLLKRVGLRPGDLVLDFGCGSGCYTIPAAGVVGKRGVIYALDKNRYLLADLVKEASSRGLTNVLPANSLEDLKRILAGSLLQGVLLYDVIHSYYFTSRERKSLLRSVAALVMREGLISIFPRHMSSPEIGEIGNCLEAQGFPLETELEADLLHDEHFSSGRIYTFRKAAGRMFTLCSPSG
jgi:cyclopropane fatty-acyl-phospholipid synthase-like methyltransferase